MAWSGADHWSTEVWEEEREFGVSCSMRVDLGFRCVAVRGETKKAGAYCPGFQNFVSVPSEGQSKVRDTSCSAIIRRRLMRAYRMRPRAVLMLTPVSSAMSLKLMPLWMRMCTTACCSSGN